MEERTTTEQGTTYTVISVRSPAWLKEKLDKMASEDRRTLSNFVVLILENHVAEREREESAAVAT